MSNISWEKWNQLPNFTNFIPPSQSEFQILVFLRMFVNVSSTLYVQIGRNEFPYYCL